jgi:hypothetical protein
MLQLPQNWVEDWCRDNGWTDLFVERRQFWAFPPGAVMPQPIPRAVLADLKALRGLSPAERLGTAVGLLATALAVTLSVWGRSPLPLTLAFAALAAWTGILDDDPCGSFPTADRGC